MFIDNASFKRMTKEAWKEGGLNLGNDGRNYLFQTELWEMRISHDAITNLQKAAVVELIGGLPKKGEYIKVKKGEPEQILLEFNLVTNTSDHQDAEKTQLIVTHNEGIFRILQNNKNIITAAREHMLNVVDEYAKTGEEINGPTIGEYYGAYVWVSYESCECLYSILGVKANKLLPVRIIAELESNNIAYQFSEV